jgi:hypothetical protein
LDFRGKCSNFPLGVNVICGIVIYFTCLLRSFSVLKDSIQNNMLTVILQK